jgi:hypothetical protein
MFAGADDLRFKLTFWIPAALFLWAVIGAVARQGIIKKVEQADVLIYSLHLATTALLLHHPNARAL